MKLYVCFKAKKAFEDQAGFPVRYDYVENLTADEVRNDELFPNGMQKEADGTLYYWGYEEMK